MQEHPPGLIGVLTGSLGRYTKFWHSMMALMSQVPPGSDVFPVKGMWICDAINIFVDVMQPQHQWLQIWADDHEFQPDTLQHLLDRQVPLVAPLCFLRSAPWHPSIFHAVGTDYQSYTLPELQGQQGLLPCDTFGGPGMLIRREVIETLGQPFFRNDPRHVTSPREDLYSISRCREAGFQPYCDLDVWIGHCFAGVMYPTRTPDLTYGVRFYADDDLIGTLYYEHLQQRFGPERSTYEDALYHTGAP